MKTKNESRFAVPAAIAAGVLISGCSTVGEGLVGEQRENILAFAEQTVFSLSAQRIDFRDSEFVYLRAISKPGASEVENLRKLLAQADRFRDETIYYSVELLRISEMNATDVERVAEYADTLGRLQQQFSLQLDIEDSELAAIEADIRTQLTLMAATRAAQPLIDLAGDQFERLIREIEERALADAVKYLDGLIEGHYAVFMENNRIMVQRRDDMLRALILIREARLGDEAAMGELRSLPLMENRGIAMVDSPSQSQLAKLEDFVLGQMKRDNRIVEYLRVDIEAYVQAHAELDREESEVLDGLNVARLQIIGWTRAHQAMANGAKEPGTWIKLAMDAAASVGRVL